MDFKRTLIDINKNLANDGIKLRIEQRGKKLSFRGPLPCRESNENSKQQRISLNLNANVEGLNEAEKLLQLLLLQLHHKQFSWQNWSKSESKAKIINKKKTLEDSLLLFKVEFFNSLNKSKSRSSAETTWDSSYKPYLRRLLQKSEQNNSSIDIRLLKEVVLSYKENSRSRQQCTTTLAAFAKHLKIKLPEGWRKLGYGYGLHQSQFRELPSEDLIKESWESIPNNRWKLVFGLMATYGLRNHEVFFSDLSCLKKNGDRVLRVLPNTKTGEHQVWPFHPEWVELFELNKLGDSPNLLPEINTDLRETTLQKVGRRVAEQFKRYQLPLRPYDLRHSWAIRTIHIGLPDTVSARMMGHSVAIHTRTYHHWITRRDQQQAVDTALRK